MIRDKTARQMFYDWHGGQGSPFYAAASSGRVACFVALLDESKAVDDEPERFKLWAWIHHQQVKSPVVTAWDGREYFALPWAKDYTKR